MPATKRTTPKRPTCPAAVAVRDQAAAEVADLKERLRLAGLESTAERFFRLAAERESDALAKEKDVLEEQRKEAIEEVGRLAAEVRRLKGLPARHRPVYPAKDQGELYGE